MAKHAKLILRHLMKYTESKVCNTLLHPNLRDAKECKITLQGKFYILVETVIDKCIDHPFKSVLKSNQKLF